MLTGKQKRYLRSQAHHVTPTFQIGKSGLNDNMIEQLNEILENRELIKIHILQNNMGDKKELAEAVISFVFLLTFNLSFVIAVTQYFSLLLYLLFHLSIF